MERGDDTLVHCNAGISRSAGVVTATIAAETRRSWRDVLWDVEKARSIANPNKPIRTSIERYVAENASSEE